MAITTLNNRAINRSDTASSGQRWTATSATAADFQDAAASGLTAASQWRITSAFAGDGTPVNANWEEADAPAGFGVLGTSMTESSGIFTFPSTGYWLIQAQTKWSANDGTEWNTMEIHTTHDNSTYVKASEVTSFALVGDTDSMNCSYIMDVTSTSTHKCRMNIYQVNNVNTVLGDTALHLTGFTFLRLADT
jgi:hypothetical protein